MTTEEQEVPVPEPARGHDVFVSYSRADRDAVVALTDGLASRGKRAWVDLEDIPPSAEWMSEIRRAIDAADGYLVAVSPDLAASKVCAEELGHAKESGKRIVPVLVRPTDPSSVPDALAALNWIDSTDGRLDDALDRVVSALDTDLEHVRAHSRLLGRAREWESKASDRSLLLRGSDLSEAEAFLVQAQGKEPAPTTDQARFISASRQGASRRQRVTIAAIAVALVISLALAGFAIVQRNEAADQREQAIEQRDLARSGDLASAALSQISIDPELSLLLAIEAAEIRRTARVEDALRASLEASQITLVYDEYAKDVNDIAFGPDGSWVAGSSTDGTIKVFDAQTGETLQTIATGDAGTPEANTFALVVEPSGRWIASAGEAGGVRLWDPATGELLRTLRFDGIVYSLSLSGEGDRLVAAGERAVAWDPDTGQELLELEAPDGVWGVGISPDGVMIATGAGDGVVRIWDGRNGTLLQELPGHQGLAWGAAFSDDGKRLVTAGEDRTARVWDVATGGQLVLLPHVSLIQDAQFTPDGAYVVTADSEGVGRVWSLDTGEPVTELRGHETWITYLDVSPSGDRVVTGSVDGTARVWRLGPGASELTLDRGAMTWGAEYSPDGSMIVAAGTTDAAQLVDAATGEVLRTLVALAEGDDPVQLGGAWFSPDASLVAATGNVGFDRFEGFIQLWDIGGEPLDRFDLGAGDAPVTIDFSPDGSRLVTATVAGATIVWDVETGDRLATYDGTPCTLEFPGGAQACSAVFTPDGALLAISDGSVAILWDPETDEVVRTFEPTGGGLETRGTAIHDVAFGPDGSTLLTASMDQTARLWDVRTGEQLVVFAGHGGPVMTAGFHPDGSHVVTASQDGTARVWSIEGEELQRYRAAELVVTSAAFSPDGTKIVVTTAEGFNFAPPGVPIEEVTTGDAKVYACDVCLSSEGLLALARERVTRELTPEERATYLGESP